MAINRRTWAGVVWSISSLDLRLKRAFEPHSPGVAQRLRAMARLAEAGITVGTALMPILPLVGDDLAHMDEVVRATADHGGSFVLAGGLTMDGVQAEMTLEAYGELDPALVPPLREFYGWREAGTPAYGPSPDYARKLMCTVREFCQRHGIRDRMPRLIAAGPLATNKRIAERLFLRTYELELEGASGYRTWAYRKAAWAVDESPQNIVELYVQRGDAGLRELPGVSQSLAAQIGGWIREETGSP